jgi:hypothetical protein
MLTARQRRRFYIDFDQPVAILMIAILHFTVDEEYPYSLVSQFKSAMSSGGYLVVVARDLGQPFRQGQRRSPGCVQ